MIHERSAWQTGGVYAGPSLFLLAFFLPVEMPIRIATGTLLWTLAWWVTECAPLGIASLLPPFIFSVTGILTWKSALSSFADPILWIFMAGFVLAAAFRKWKLDEQIARTLSALYRGKNPIIAALIIAGLPVFLLTLTGSITASTSVVYPFVLTYLSLSGIGAKSRFAEALLLFLAQAATAGAMLLLISTPPNLVAKNTIERLSLSKLDFLDWLIIGTPHAIIGLLVAWVLVFLVLRPPMTPIQIEPASEGPTDPRLRKGRLITLALLLGALLLWFAPGILKLFTADPQLRSMIATVFPETMPAVLLIFLAAVVPVHEKPLLEWNEIATGIDWNVISLFGGGIALGLGLEASGFAALISEGLRQMTANFQSAHAIFAVASCVGFILTYAASNTAAAIIACPIAAALANSAGVPVEPPIIGAALACSISSAIPSTTPPMAIVYSSGNVSIWSMFKVGVACDIARLLLLILTGPYLIRLVYP